MIVGEPLVKTLPGAIPALAYAAHQPGQLRIISVDGVAVARTSNRVEVLPGIHVLEVECKLGKGKKQTLEIYVSAGHTYILGANYYHETQECTALVIQEGPL